MHSTTHGCVLMKLAKTKRQESISDIETRLNSSFLSVLLEFQEGRGAN